MSCPFCDALSEGSIVENALAAAVADRFPTNPGHTLVVPKRHVRSWFETTPEERTALLELVDQVKQWAERELLPAGYNIGINDGPAAGQTVMHLHIHVIPRFDGDVDDPAGGVRFVIPERGNYRRPGFIPRVQKAGDDAGE
ncbi:MAG: HIT family protein [Acidobacteria bacterium]|nr:MAG: HIT family protein [Acidobacteriota bacterium]